MQSSKEQQGEIRKPSSEINAKKQRKTIEWDKKKNKMEKTRDLFNKIRDTKGTNISCKDGFDKGQKWYRPNRSRRYQEEVTRIHRRTVQKDLHDPDNHNGVITHLEPDIL